MSLTENKAAPPGAAFARRQSPAPARFRCVAVTECYVCGCDDDQACPGGCSWIEPRYEGQLKNLCSRCGEVKKHHVRMWTDQGTKESVGTCVCGFEARMPYGKFAELDFAVRQHWISVVMGSGRKR